MSIRKAWPCEGCSEVPIDLEGDNHWVIEVEEHMGRYGQVIEDHLHCCSTECVQAVINDIGTNTVHAPDDTRTIWVPDRVVAQHNADNAKAGGWSGD